MKQLLYSALTDEVSIAAVMKSTLAGPMLPEDKSKVVEAVSSKLNNMPDIPQPGANSAKHPLQSHLHFFNYLTATDWTVLTGPLSLTDKTSYLATRCACAGFPNKIVTVVARISTI